MADQSEFFDTDERLGWRSTAGGPIERLAAVVTFKPRFTGLALRGTVSVAASIRLIRDGLFRDGSA